MPSLPYSAMYETAALVDRSDRGKLALTGSDAKEFLHGQVTNDVCGLTPGSGRYAAFLTHKGRMLGDLRILDAGAELLIDCERVALQDLFNMIRRYKLASAVELHKRTLQRGLLSLVGPAARTLAGAADLPAVEHAHRPGELAGVPVRLIATDLGVDVLCDAADTEALTAALTEAGAVPSDPQTAEIRRIESGRPRYGVELDDSVIPQEAGLNERAVAFDKGCYIGQETVARLHFRGRPNRLLRGLRLADLATGGDELRAGEKTVGRIGSVAQSPEHGWIGLALVRREVQPGDTIAAGATTATVIAPPFSRS